MKERLLVRMIPSRDGFFFGRFDLLLRNYSRFGLTGAHGVVLSWVFSAGLVVLLATPLVIPVYMVVGSGGKKVTMAANGNDVESVRQPLVAAEQERKVEEEEGEGEKQAQHVQGTVVIIGEELFLHGWRHRQRLLRDGGRSVFLALAASGLAFTSSATSCQCFCFRFP